MRTLPLLLTLIALPGFSQTMYKCPNAAGVAQYQQMPCTPQGGGEAIEQKTIKPTGGAGLSDDAKSYLNTQSEERAERNRLAAEEAKRQEALDVEKAKAVAAHEQAKAAQEQAAAQRATARAIWATGRRY